jgi:Transcriptional repressor TCF25
MSTRALRKAQRELEEQNALQEAEQADEESDEEEQRPTKPTQQSVFALLNAQEGEDDDDDNDDDEPEKENVKVGKEEPKAVTPPVTKSTKKKKKKKKKKKAKAGNKVEDKDDDDSDFDAELASAMANNNAKLANSQTGKEESAKPVGAHPSEKVCQLLSVNTQNLHVANEMRRLFGRDAVDAERRAPAPARRGGRRGQGEPDRGFPALSLRRNIFIQGKEEWPRATTGGLGMEVVKKHEDGTIEYRFIHSTAYQSAQRDYEIAVASMDHNRMISLLQQNPYHIATLLQVSEIMKHQGQHAEAGDLLERVLFSFGRAVHSTFSHSLSQGKARLSFRHPENREFFLSTWRYIQNISMRSTWRTVYEWAKLLLSLAPEEDPYAIELVLDQYALRAQQGQHYLELLGDDYLNWKGDEPRHAHISWSLALAFLQTSQKEEARVQLGVAIHNSPHLAHALLRELDIDPLPAPLWSHHEPSSPHEALFTILYITRSKDLWLVPEATALLVEMATKTNDPSDSGHDDTVSLAEARHIYLTENDAFLRLLSSCHIESLGSKPSPGARPTWDPFPPSNNIQSYDPYPAGWVGGLGGRGMTRVAPGLEVLGNLRGLELEELMREIAELRPVGEFEDGEDAEREGAGIEELMARLGITRRSRLDGDDDGDDDDDDDDGEESTDDNDEMPEWD